MNATYGVWEEFHYYAGTLRAPADGFVADPTNPPFPVVFSSKEEAEKIAKWMEELSDERTHLNPSEYAYPTYRVRAFRDKAILSSLQVVSADQFLALCS